MSETIPVFDPTPSYPSAPWTLRGEAFQTSALVSIKRARAFVPPELEIVPILPGKTLGGLYFARYGEGSDLQYHELIVVAALARFHGKVGAWVSHIYVDNERSMLGGRQIWGPPKQMASFYWREREIAVAQGDHLLCSMNWKRSIPLWTQKASAPTLSRLEDRFVLFKGKAQAKISPGIARIEVSEDAPFASLSLEGLKPAAQLGNLRLLALSPEALE